MESWTVNEDYFQVQLWTDVVADASPTTPPTSYLYVHFDSNTLCINEHFRDPQHPIAWQQQVENALLTVLLHGGCRVPIDVSPLAAMCSRYFDEVVSPASHGRSIVVNALIADPEDPVEHPVDDEMMMSEEDPVEDPVDDEMMMYEEDPVEDPVEDCEFQENEPEVAEPDVDVFGQGEAEKMYADASCTICLDGFEEGELLFRMPCHHRFHMECLEKWLRRSTVCPLCRFDLC